MGDRGGAAPLPPHPARTTGAAVAGAPPACISEVGKPAAALAKLDAGTLASGAHVTVAAAALAALCASTG